MFSDFVARAASIFAWILLKRRETETNSFGSVGQPCELELGDATLNYVSPVTYCNSLS